MRHTFFILLFAIISLSLTAGGNNPAEPTTFRNNTCRTDFGSYTVSDGSDPVVMKWFLQTHAHYSQDKPLPLELTFSTSSPGGYHYTFCQLYGTLPVFNSEIIINVSRKNIVYSIFDNSYDIWNWNVDLTDFNYLTIPAYPAYLKKYFVGEIKSTNKKVVAYDEKTNTPELCYLINLRDRLGHQRDLLMARDRIIYEHDACMYRSAPPLSSDSLVTGMVFNPDPLTTAHVDYYAPYMGHDSAYQNYNDSDTYQLNIQRISKPFNASYNAGVFSLSNQYVQLVQLGSDPYTPVTSTTPTFNYTRSQNGFLDVMVYYHLNVMSAYTRSLGFGLGDSLIKPDPHAFTADQDFFSAPDNIYYGTGGVPDCQDADVILHEYTHFLSWNANHTNGAGASTQRNGIDEGSADYNATSYSASIDTFRWYNVFTWDGHNEYWPGRIANDRTVYPALPSQPSGTTTIYKYGEIWSSALMQIWWDIGRGPADSLFYQTLYGLGGNITLLDAAQQYIKADSLLYGGRYHCIIVRDLNQHGLAADTTCGTYPLAISEPDQTDQFKFISYPDGFRILTSSSDMPVDIALYDVAGRRVATYTDVSSEVKPSLPNGIYIIDASAGGVHHSFKWVLVK